jgi:hypothetical protein
LPRLDPVDLALLARNTVLDRRLCVRTRIIDLRSLPDVRATLETIEKDDARLWTARVAVGRKPCTVEDLRPDVNSSAFTAPVGPSRG